MGCSKVGVRGVRGRVKGRVSGVRGRVKGRVSGWGLVGKSNERICWRSVNGYVGGGVLVGSDEGVFRKC